jgi:hypothetical protein
MSLKNFAIICMFVIVTAVTFLLSYEMLRIFLLPTREITIIWVQVLAFIALSIVLLIYATIVILLIELAIGRI